MVMPSTPVVLVALAVLAILLAVDWYLGGMAYSLKPMRSRVEDLPKHSEADSFRKAA
jgi:hypothetical protein